MKILAIGDIHGRQNWKIPFYNEEWDICVFIGDYFDSFDLSAVEQINNFKEIIEAKKTSDKKVVMLVGNHDHHYLPGCAGGTSGYQTKHAIFIQELLLSNIEHLQMAYYEGGYLFSHAGISKDFLKLRSVQIDYSDPVKMVDELNDLLKYKPKSFMFNGRDPYGDDLYQTPIWIRERSLFESRVPYKQVVGHTQKEDIIYKEDIHFIDALAYNKYLILDV